MPFDGAPFGRHPAALVRRVASDLPHPVHRSSRPVRPPAGAQWCPAHARDCPRSREFSSRKGPKRVTRLPSALRPLFPLIKSGVLHATQALSPLTRRLPAATPPRHAAPTASSYARDHPDGGVDVVEVVAALDLHRPLPAGLPADFPQFEAHRHAHIGPNVVATVRRGRVLMPYGAVMTEDDTLLFDLSPYYGADQAVATPGLLALPPAGGHGRLGLRRRPHDAGERELLPLRARRPAPAGAVAAGRRGARRLRGEPLDALPARPARPPGPDRRPLSRRGEVSPRPGRRARRAVAAGRPTAHAALDRALAPLAIPARRRAPAAPPSLRHAGPGEAHAPRRERSGAGCRPRPVGLRGHRPRRALAGGTGARLRRGRVHRGAARRRA